MKITNQEMMREEFRRTDGILRELYPNAAIVEFGLGQIQSRGLIF